MAYRDKSQGFAFVYVDIKKLLDENRKQKGAVRPEPSSEVSENKAFNFNKDPKPESQSPIRMAPWKQSRVQNEQHYDKAKSVQKIKENLDRLQSLHHKLHSVLADLNKSSKKKK